MAYSGSNDLEKHDQRNGSVQEVQRNPSLEEELEENERKARVNAAWETMNKGLPVKIPKTFVNRPIPDGNAVQKTPKTPEWMVALGLAPKRTLAAQENLRKRPVVVHNCSSEEARKAAAAALSAVREVTSASASAGKVEITDVRDFAGEEIEVKKLVNSSSKEAAGKIKAAAGTQPSALDAILDQIKKKQKLSVLDKTKKDWGEFKEENKGLEEELGAYKKSSNQYLDKVSFLQRADVREFERERDARLAMQARRKPADMREDDDL
ncbi:hypothetical protein AXF42_Ash007810 [Apostasia shenzhenica]|uniref:BCNT-C domain-containing protein n=1 Tax=Apostasia shenzhenica TaxID=1088818 RepID=A0A2I0B5E0_9ASPA|nr:hypothetical protein AXF42_Ash007810 [Apostasia shenzhenica]